MPHPSRVLLAATLLVVTAAPARSEDASDLLKYAPPHANAVVVVNQTAILGSPRAVKEGWAKADHTEYLAGAIPINPRFGWVVAAKQVNPQASTHGHPFAVASVKAPLDIDRLVKVSGGKAGTAGGESVVVTPHGSFLVPLDKSVLGVAWTDNRQDVGRWVRTGKAATVSPLSKYLNAAVYNYTRHHVVVALDAEDLFDARQAGLAVALTKTIGGKEDSATVEAFVAALRGVILTIDVTADGLSATARFDSGVIKKVPADAFKAFVIELLGRNGASFEDLAAATVTPAEGYVTLRFKMSDPELALVMGLFLPPIPNVSAEDKVPVTPAGVTPAATKAYMLAANRILDDLKRQNGTGRDYSKSVVWHDAAANRLETISLLNVDPIAVEYGAGTAARLRAVADSLRGVPVQIAALNDQAYAVYSSNGVSGRRGSISTGGSLQTNAPEIYQKEVELIQKDRANRERVWDEIDRRRIEVRRLMAEKHKIDTEAVKK